MHATSVFDLLFATDSSRNVREVFFCSFFTVAKCFLSSLLSLICFGDKVIETMADGDFPCLVQAAGGLGWKANPGLDPPPCRRVGLRMIDPIT